MLDGAASGDRGKSDCGSYGKQFLQGRGKKSAGAEADRAEDWTKKDYIEENYKLALRIGLRPAEFWKLTPVELAEIAEAHYERRREREKGEWRRAAFLASWIINTAGKSYERDISADELVKFKDEVGNEEVKPLDPEERRRQADESFMRHKQKAWMLLKVDEDGKIKVFDEEKLIELKKKYRKNN